MDLEEVNKLLDLRLPLIDEYQTLGGFLLYQYQKIPVQGETLHYDNLELTVVSAEGPRLHQIRIHRQEVASQSQNISVSDVTEVMTKKDAPINDGRSNSKNLSSKDQDSDRDFEGNVGDR
jgi:hypothetical protein